MKILVVAGHPADMFDHCGATLKHHIDRGDSVTCVTLTQGLRIHDEVISDLMRTDVHKYSDEEIDELIEQRKRYKYREALAACKLFGIEDVRFLEYDDEILTLNVEMISKVAALIRNVQPEMVITHWPLQEGGIDNHHSITGQIVKAACTAARGVNFQDKNPACRVRQLVYMLCPFDVFPTNVSSCNNIAYPSFYVDCTDDMELKIKAISMMKSQKYDTKGFAFKTSIVWAGFFGARVGVPYAEGFAFENPEVGQYLPLCDHLKWMGSVDEHEIIKNHATIKGMDLELDERE